MLYVNLPYTPQVQGYDRQSNAAKVGNSVIAAKRTKDTDEMVWTKSLLRCCHFVGDDIKALVHLQKQQLMLP